MQPPGFARVLLQGDCQRRIAGGSALAVAVTVVFALVLIRAAPSRSPIFSNFSAKRWLAIALRFHQPMNVSKSICSVPRKDGEASPQSSRNSSSSCAAPKSPAEGPSSARNSSLSSVLSAGRLGYGRDERIQRTV